ncbi:MAG: hypothetical protein ACTHJ5_04235 [Ilyomonas sp.]
MKNLVLVLVCLISVFGAAAQKIVYSEPDRDDTKSTNFDIIGKMNDHILILKNNRNDYSVSVLDNDMKLVDKVKLTFLPERVINTEILSYKDFFYLFYQYQRRSIVYCMAAKINSEGKLAQDPVQLDTTEINFLTNNKIYSFLFSEDKQKIAALKINSKNDKNYLVTTSIFDENLNPVAKNTVGVPMPERNDFLTEFSVDNNGDLVFVRAYGTSQNDNISHLTLITKKEKEDTIASYDLPVSKIYLDDIRIKVDNVNKNYLITSFFTRARRGNIEGLYCTLWDKTQAQPVATTSNVFSEELRNNAKSQGNSKFAFNDYFLQNIIMRRDGGFMIAAESVYSSSRGNTMSRWDYLYGSPYWSPSDYYLYSSPFSSYGYYYYPWWRNSYYNTRYFADNIAILLFDSSANIEWANVIPKSQYDDNTDNFIGYTTMNTGSDIHFLFNQTVRKTMILSDQSISADGQVHRSPTLRNLDRGYEFMPRFAKQVGSKEMIIPCQYRNYICFAKIDF